MLRNNFIIVCGLVAFLQACGGGGSPTAMNPDGTPANRPTQNTNITTRPRPVTDLTLVPIRQAFATKYSRLQLLCATTAHVPSRASASGTDIKETPTVVWDLLKEKHVKTITFKRDLGPVNYTYTLATHGTLYTGSYVGNTFSGQYTFKNAAEIVGSFSGQTKLSDLDGKTIGTAEESQSPDSRSLFENVPNQLLKVSSQDPNGKLSYSLEINCTLQADVLPAYAKDTTTPDQQPKN